MKNVEKLPTLELLTLYMKHALDLNSGNNTYNEYSEWSIQNEINHRFSKLDALIDVSPKEDLPL